MQDVNQMRSDALRNLVPSAQFKKREKEPWRSVTFGKVAGFSEGFSHECFSRFLNCANATKSRNASQLSNLTINKLYIIPVRRRQ